MPNLSVTTSNFVVSPNYLIHKRVYSWVVLAHSSCFLKVSCVQSWLPQLQFNLFPLHSIRIQIKIDSSQYAHQKWHWTFFLSSHWTAKVQDDWDAMELSHFAYSLSVLKCFAFQRAYLYDFWMIQFLNCLCQLPTWK